jgi:hypothetical protein
MPVSRCSHAIRPSISSFAGRWIPSVTPYRRIISASSDSGSDRCRPAAAKGIGGDGRKWDSDVQ